MLEELHETHLGANKMKGLEQGYVWWPKMNKDIEEVTIQCSYCQQASSSPSKAPLHLWEWPSQPLSRLHWDFVEPFMGRMYIVGHSRCPFKMAGCQNNAIHYIGEDH